MDFDAVYRARVPAWDIGRAQPALVRLAEDGRIQGTVLDVGCGTGANCLYLASRGLDVVGVDSAPTAIATARQKADDRGLTATFLPADALDLGSLERAFDTAIDSGLSMSSRTPIDHASSEASTACFAPAPAISCSASAIDNRAQVGPRRVSQAEIRRTFSVGWRVDSIVAEHFATQDPNCGPRAPYARLASLTCI